MTEEIPSCQQNDNCHFESECAPAQCDENDSTEEKKSPVFQTLERNSQVSRQIEKMSSRMTGYLEKRSKILGWKKYWCVLDGRLLTYYKSKSDYEALCACAGSINLGIATTVRPLKIKGCKGYPIQIITRTQVYYLRSLDKSVLDKWLLAIQEVATTTCPNSPYYESENGNKFSFSSLSQWSLQSSGEDLSSSFLHISYNNAFVSPEDTKIHKYNSFTSLQFPSPGFSPFKKMMAGRKIASKSRLEKSSANGSHIVDNLRRELVRKLSSGSTSPVLKAKSPSRDKVNEHYYDEIVDFEATYENCRDSVAASSTASEISGDISPMKKILDSSVEDENTGDIYEQVDTATELNGEIWEKMDKIHRTSYRSNGSSSKRNSLVSITEVPETQTNGESEKKEVSQCTDKREDPETMATEEKIINSNSIDHELTMEPKLIENESTIDQVDNSGEKEQKKKWKPFEKLFQRVFHTSKRKNKSDKEISVITGPIDLRNLSKDSATTPQMSFIEPEKKKGMKKSHSFAVHNRSRRNTEEKLSLSSSNSSRRESIMDELKMKVEQRKSSGSSIESKKSVGTEHKDKISQDQENTNCNKEEPIVKENEAFKEKLARFDRMSRQYGWSEGSNNNHINHGGKKIGRSTSCKLTKISLLETPMVPPKRKSVPASVVYDIPQNNQPLKSHENQIIIVDIDMGERETKTESDGRSSANRRHTPLDPKVLLSSFTPEPADEDRIYGNICPSVTPPSVELEQHNGKDESTSCSSLSTPSPICDAVACFEESVKEIKAIGNTVLDEKNENLDTVEEAIYCNVDEPLLHDEDATSDRDGSEKIEKIDETDCGHKLIYENMKFAIEERVVQEFETVEEDQYANEIAELYDDFPCEFSTPSMQSAMAIGTTSMDTKHTTESLDSIRNSGILQLEKFLKEDDECNNMEGSSIYSNVNVFAKNPCNDKTARAGAINRLGHSPAVDQLKKLL